MTHDEAFIQSIREAPHSDAPRLIYADWLEEHGQPERAEFIRVQCRLAGLPEMTADHASLMARAEELLRRNWGAWVGPLRRIVGGRYARYGMPWLGEEYDPRCLARFHKGFLTILALDASDFLRHTSELNRLTPLRKLFLYRSGLCATAVLTSPALAGLTSLGLADVYSVAPLTAHDALLLARSPHLQGLTALYLRGNSLGDEGVEALAGAPWLVSLVLLDLSDNGLSDRGAFALAQSPYLMQLNALFLQRNYFSRRGIAALKAAPHFRRLQVLDYDPPTENGGAGGGDRP
jgi:uncharacterized protein (TIGR02996 family)